MNYFTLGLLGILLSSTVTFAADCTEKFSWLPNPESNITGYNIHYGSTNGGPYPDTVFISDLTPIDGRIWGEVSGLICDEQYYFVCTATNDAGLESVFSNQIDLIAETQSTEEPSTETVTKIFGSAAGADYIGTIQDTFININTTTSSTLERIGVYTWPENMTANAIIIKADLSQLPDNAQIQSATLQLYAYEAGGDSIYTISAHKIINTNPDLSASTGYTYDGINNWTANTDCYNNIPMAQADIGAVAAVNNVDMSAGYKSWDVTTIVEDWQASPGTNYGLLLNPGSVATSDSYRNFASTEAADSAQKPKLVITYTVNTIWISTPTGLELLN